MKQIVADRNTIAFCGLYCGVCKFYLKGRCPGCGKNTKAGWCGVRKCCMEHGYASCADCIEFSDPDQCRKFNNFISKIFGVVFNSDRQACIMKIRELGPEAYAAFMVGLKRQSIPRR